MKSKRTKALEISKATRIRVALRDSERCVLCGRKGLPEAHYISRAHGGLGVEENIVTLCRECHRRYDQTIERDAIREILRDYLSSQYPDWNEENLIYRK